MIKHGGSYYLGTGTHQMEFKRLRAALVPVAGAAATPHGELLRAVGDLYYDLRHDGFAHLADRWADWHTVYAHRHAIAAAIGSEGAWVFAVVDRAMTARYLAVAHGDGDPRPFPHDAFERLVDGCVVVVRDVHAPATNPSADRSLRGRADPSPADETDDRDAAPPQAA